MFPKQNCIFFRSFVQIGNFGDSFLSKFTVRFFFVLFLSSTTIIAEEFRGLFFKNLIKFCICLSPLIVFPSADKIMSPGFKPESLAGEFSAVAVIIIAFLSFNNPAEHLARQHSNLI